MKFLFKRAAIAVIAVSSLIGCSSIAQKQELSERQKTAIAMFQERCKKSGEFIHRTVDDVEGVYLMKLRPNAINYGDQYKLDDPYGRDLGGIGYIEYFLRGSYAFSQGKTDPESTSRGYMYVEAIDPKDGVRYRYTGRIEEPWQQNTSYLKGYLRFVVDHGPSPGAAPRYAVTYDDISTREERDHWIAGSSLRVIDTQTNEVLAERVGYMIDIFQGSRAGNRAPWLFAADNACPRILGGSSGQRRQTDQFVEKILKPKTH